MSNFLHHLPNNLVIGMLLFMGFGLGVTLATWYIEHFVIIVNIGG